MTASNGFDRTLTDWLAAENAPDVPDRVFEAAFADVRTTGQSRPMAEALTRWLRPRDTLPGPRPHGLGARRPVAFAVPAIILVALVVLAMLSAVLLIGASRLWPDRLFTTNRFHAVGSIADPGAGSPGTLTSLPDGRALVTDGVNLDLFDPSTGQFVRSSSRLSMPRQGESATLLRDGTVLIIGGGADDRVEASSGGSQAELFDPATGTVTQLGATLEPHTDGSATLLADGRVLLAGAPWSPQSSVPAELYDPATQSFRRTGSTTQAWPLHRAVLLGDRRVLILGGGIAGLDHRPRHQVVSVGSYDASAELFDPVTEQFSATGPMALIQRDATATALSDGRVLLVGGSEWDPASNDAAITDAVQIYDPASGSFTLAGRLPTPRIGHAAVLLDDGDVLVMGGVSELGSQASARLADALRWERETGEFVPAVSMTRWRLQFLSTQLEDGRVLAIGHTGLSLYEALDDYPWVPGEGPLPVADEEELQTTWSAEVFE